MVNGSEQGAFGKYESFVNLGDAVMRDAFQRTVVAEEQLIQLITAKFYPRGYADFEKKVLGKEPSLHGAMSRAEVEAATLLTKYPQLIAVTPVFPSLYRLLRCAELSHGLRRSGTSLLVGSGTTIDEVAAVSVIPPNEKDMSEFFEGYKPGVLANVITQVPSKQVPPLDTHGQVIAVEPNRQAMSALGKANYFFHVPGRYVIPLPVPLGEVLYGSMQLPDVANIDLVLFHRAEPQVFIPDAAGRGGVSDITKRVARNIAPGGHFALTVGGGNTIAEMRDRLRLLGETASVLPDSGLSILPSFEGKEFTGKQKSSFGGLLFGAVGGLIDAKQ